MRVRRIPEGSNRARLSCNSASAGMTRFEMPSGSACGSVLERLRGASTEFYSDKS